ncbi:hypothetical protein CCP3SC1AL1_3010004 [Gammaproteobacteria bacterium]
MTEDKYEYDDEIVCPYCNERWDNSWETIREEDSIEEIECYECGKKFYGQKIVSIDYKTMKDCELNGEKHDFQPCKYAERLEECSKCYKSQLKK